MLIVSKFHDYYDTAIGFDGVDKTCVYNRVPKVEISKEVSKIFEIKMNSWRDGPYQYKVYSSEHKMGSINEIIPFVVGFCGKTYVGYVFYRDGKDRYT
jgi:hypothetical protein